MHPSLYIAYTTNTNRCYHPACQLVVRAPRPAPPPPPRFPTHTPSPNAQLAFPYIHLLPRPLRHHGPSFEHKSLPAREQLASLQAEQAVQWRRLTRVIDKIRLGHDASQRSSSSSPSSPLLPGISLLQANESLPQILDNLEILRAPRFVEDKGAQEMAQGLAATAESAWGVVLSPAESAWGVVLSPAGDALAALAIHRGGLAERLVLEAGNIAVVAVAKGRGMWSLDSVVGPIAQMAGSLQEELDNAQADGSTVSAAKTNFLEASMLDDPDSDPVMRDPEADEGPESSPPPPPFSRA